MGFRVPKIRGTLMVPVTKGCGRLGSMLGSPPVFGNYHL